MGWGLFNLIEGIVDHHVLGIHHVVERLSLSVYDYAFLISGVLLIAIGVGIIHMGRADECRVAAARGQPGGYLPPGRARGRPERRSLPQYECGP